MNLKFSFTGCLEATNTRSHSRSQVYGQKAKASITPDRPAVRFIHPEKKKKKERKKTMRPAISPTGGEREPVKAQCVEDRPDPTGLPAGWLALSLTSRKVARGGAPSRHLHPLATPVP